MMPECTQRQRDILARIIFSWILLALLWRWSDSSMLSQLERPVLGNVYKDLTFWLFEWFGLQNLLTGNFWVALLLDITLTGSVVLVLIRPRSVLFPRIYTVTMLLYFVTHTTYANHHFRPIIGLLVAGVPFLFASLPRFSYFLSGLRYYVLFIYVSAGLYKVFRGSWVNTDQMSAIIERTQLELFIADPSGWHAQFYTWLLQHEMAGWMLFFLATVLEVVFLVGFFTRKWDKALFGLALSLHLGFYFTMRFFAFELIVLDLTILPWFAMLKADDPRPNERLAPVLDT